MAHLASVPKDLPVPIDDGACDHLMDMTLPSVTLPPTSSPSQGVDVSKLKGLTILFCYPRTGEPDKEPGADWNAIPGARGCTPQACSMRDSMAEFRDLGVDQVFGVSTQDTAYQKEMHDRVHLPYDLLSDEKLEFVEALNLPTFEYEGMKLIKRLCLAVQDGKVVEKWYPIFPSDSNGPIVLEWLKHRKARF